MKPRYPGNKRCHLVLMNLSKIRVCADVVRGWSHSSCPFTRPMRTGLSRTLIHSSTRSVLKAAEGLQLNEPENTLFKDQSQISNQTAAPGETSADSWVMWSNLDSGAGTTSCNQQHVSQNQETSQNASKCLETSHSVWKHLTTSGNVSPPCWLSFSQRVGGWNPALSVGWMKYDWIYSVNGCLMRSSSVWLNCSSLRTRCHGNDTSSSPHLYLLSLH